MIRPFLNAHPQLDDTVFVASSAVVIGDVTVGPRSSLWYHAVVRGDVHWIEIGAESNVQDQAVIHVTHGTAPTRIGDRVTVAHGAIIHGCTIEDEVMIGMGAVVMDHAVIGRGSLVGARALVTGRTKIPPGSLVLGSPARVVRTLSQEEQDEVRQNALNYVRYRGIYLGEETPDTNPFYTPRDRR